MKKIAVIGANGQLGTDLVEVLSKKNEVIGLTHSDIDITKIDSVNDILKNIKPDIVLNAASYTNVPKCEELPELAFSVNAVGVLNIARICSDIDARFFHYSTDYVFDGKKREAYVETDCPNPLNVYGNTKLSGEYFALNYCDKSFVIRLSGIYGKVPSRVKGGNFITTMLKLAKEKPQVEVVNDEILSPTPTYEIAKNSAELIKANTDAFGVYHMTCEGECSWYEFAKTIWETLQLKTPLHPVSVNNFPSNVKRPFYSVLENNNLNKAGINKMPDWDKALIAFLKKEIHPKL